MPPSPPGVAPGTLPATLRGRFNPAIDEVSYVSPGNRHALIRDLLIFWSVVLLVVLAWRSNGAVTLIIVAAYLLRYLFWPNKEDHIFFAAGAVIGSAAEVVATRAGIWSYTLPTFLNIPVWLPFAWGFAVVVIIRIAQAFVKK
jgi:uncharacterized membrane protein